jgi:hypothetical protein
LQPHARLEKLHLQGNRLQSFDPALFPALREIDLAENTIAQMVDNAKRRDHNWSVRLSKQSAPLYVLFLVSAYTQFRTLSIVSRLCCAFVGLYAVAIT